MTVWVSIRGSENSKCGTESSHNTQSSASCYCLGRRDTSFCLRIFLVVGRASPSFPPADLSMSHTVAEHTLASERASVMQRQKKNRKALLSKPLSVWSSGGSIRRRRCPLKLRVFNLSCPSFAAHHADSFVPPTGRVLMIKIIADDNF